jgi:hypothetical protein
MGEVSLDSGIEAGSHGQSRCESTWPCPEGGAMTSTISSSRGEVTERPDRSSPRNRGLLIAVVVLAVIAVGLGIALVAQVSTDDDGTAVPDDVQAVVDEYLLAVENVDFEAMQAVVTEDFRRPFYEGDPAGTGLMTSEGITLPEQDVWTIEDFEAEFWDSDTAVYDVEHIGDPIVQGDGPWYVSVAQHWTSASLGNQFDAIYTFAVVDEDGTLKIDDAYWAGNRSVFVEAD